MTTAQILILAILAATIGLFLWGRLRHDVVALAALLACVLAGLVPAAEAFAGFGHPAVITVACVLVLSAALQASGAVDILARTVLPQAGGRTTSLGALLALGALLSGFMNNVGAMALLMPVAVTLAGRLGLAPGQVLMPLAFATILGGMTTLVGTPPNLIVSSLRDASGAGAFGMFDFAPVGLAVAGAGIVFTVLVGWRLVPARRPLTAEGFETGAYLTEVSVPEGSKAAGLTLRAFEDGLGAADAQVVALVRNAVRLSAPHGGRKIRAGDILVLEAEVGTLAEALAAYGMDLAEAPKGADGEAAAGDGAADDGAGGADADSDGEADRRGDGAAVLREFAVLPGAGVVGRSAADLRLRTRYGVSLLAVSRGGRKPVARLRRVAIKAGDLLLMQGPPEVLADFAAETGCVPLGDRDLRLPDRRKAFLSAAIMAASVAVAAFGLLSAAMAFALGVLATMLTQTLTLRRLYTVIDWPVIVLLAALIPVAGAMETTGAAGLVARVLVDGVAQGNAVAALTVILVVTMVLSDVMNNAATAAVMIPVALGIAGALGVSADSFLMAVAVGASCAFLTPIGHQNNTLILGPGGFLFGDYWRFGLALEVIVVAVAVPMLLVVWPL